MLASRASTTAMILAALALPAVAAADDAVVLTKLISGRGVGKTAIDDVFSLMSSEMEFMSGVSEVIELEPRPTALNPACLDSPRCLKVITQEAKGDRLIAGTADKAGDDLLVELVLYDRTTNEIVRRNTHTLPPDPGSLVDLMTPVLVELLTGDVPDRPDEAAMAGVNFDDGFGADDDDLAFAPDPVVEDPAPVTGTRTVDRAIVAPPPREPEPEPEPEPEEEEDFDPSAFDFGSSAEEISFGTDPSDIEFEEPEPEPEERSPKVRTRDESILLPDDPLLEEEEDRIDLDEGYDDEPVRRRYGDPPSRSRATKTDDDKHRFRRVHINIRGGYTNYGVFNFGTVGPELQVRAFKGLFFVAGMDVHIARQCVERTDPNTQPSAPACGGDDFTVATGLLYPINAGLLYRFKEGKLQPYAGLDAIFAQILRDPTLGTFWAGGARVRLGLDYFFTRNVGVNLDAAVGFWTSPGWNQLDPRNPNTGFLPHIGGGVVFAF